jgi:hypothetical protein
VWLAGQPCPSTQSLEDADAHTFDLNLSAGTHRLLVKAPMWRGMVSWTLGLPTDSGIELESARKAPTVTVYRLKDSALPQGQPIEGSLESLSTGIAESLSLQSSNLPISTQRGWRPLADELQDTGDFPATTTRDAVWVLDYGQECLGYVEFVIDAPAGATLITTASERLGPQGRVLSGVQGTRLHHRIVARGGVQTWHSMHPAGFRYLEIVVLPGTSAAPVTIQRFDIVRTQAPFPLAGAFESSDPALNQIWQLCANTQSDAFEDAYIDCPWRERSLYTGDQIIQYYLNLALYGDHTMMRRCIDLFYESQDDTGLLPPCSHYLPNWRHPDYAALSVEALWHYWARTGDVAYVQQMEPALGRLLEGLKGLVDGGTGLADGGDLFPYIDMSQINREGISLGLNCFLCGAFGNGAKLYRVLGNEVEAQRWQQKYTSMRSEILRAFEQTGSVCLLDRRPADLPEVKASVVGNVLALYYDILEGERARAVLCELLQTIKNNCTVENPTSTFEFHVSAYSSFYLLSVLYRRGQADAAMDYIRTQWQRMLDGGAWSCWEYFVPSDSLCHPWAASPAWFLTAHALGIHYGKAGAPSELVFAPEGSRLSYARGVLPHPAGPVEVSWQRASENGQIEAQLKAPASVRITCPNPAISMSVQQQ